MRIKVIATVTVLVALAWRPALVCAQGAKAPTFTDTIAPILYENCVTCHRPGEAAPFSLISYDEVRKRGALLATVTKSRYMPPWHAERGHAEFIGERGLTDAQIATIDTWVKTGMPQGDVKKMPTLPQFTEGWQLGKPDLILEMKTGFDLPASGPDVFRNFVLPTNLTEDKWVRAVELRPSARKVMHHALFAYTGSGTFAKIEGMDGRPGFGGMGTTGIQAGQSGNSGSLGGVAVGTPAAVFPDGLPMRLPKGTDLLLQMHFHLSGKPETEKPTIGIFFADKGPDREMFSVELPALFGVGAGFDIAPGEKSWTIRDSFTLPANIEVYSAFPHAHYLGKEITLTATLPDGGIRPLLGIKDWDFNWQDSYIYKKPFTLPKGTRLDATLTYDNSAENPRNPTNPPRRILWGEESNDEMGAVGLLFVTVNPEDGQAIRQALGVRSKAAIAAGGKDGTLGRFLTRQARARRGLQHLTVFDRQGTVIARVGEPAQYSQPAFSPDATRLVVIKGDLDTGNQDVWSFDVATGKGMPITSDAAVDATPVWSPDGSQIAYVSTRNNINGLYRRASNGKGAEELLYQFADTAPKMLTDWSADGRALLYWVGNVMYVLPLNGERKPIELKQEDFPGRGGRLSPDGRFLAFNSSLGGLRTEVAIKALDPSSGAALPGPGVAKVKEPGFGGISWRQDGKELFFLSGPSIMAVDVTSAPTLQTGTAQKLFQVPHPPDSPGQLSSVVSRDGQRFVFAVNVQRAAPAQ